MAANVKKSPEKKEASAEGGKKGFGLDLKWLLAAVGIGAIAMGGAIIGIQLAPAKFIVKEKETFVEKAPEKKVPGPTAPILTGQVINLKGGNFLRFSVAVQFVADEKLWPAGGGGSGGHGAKAVDPLERHYPMMKDLIVSMASKHTASELLSVSGKERLKDEIKNALNAEFGHEVAHAPAGHAPAGGHAPAEGAGHGHGGGGGDAEEHPTPEVLRVFFTDFVIQ